MSEADTLYDRDFYAWTRNQAEALRALPVRMRPNALDVEHLAEEIEDLGKSERRAAQSLLRQIVLHLLKLRFHPNDQPRLHWRREIREFRVQLEQVFAESPSLRARRGELAEGAFGQAARQFCADLSDEGHDAEALCARLATAGPPFFDLETEVLDPEWFPPRP